MMKSGMFMPKDIIIESCNLTVNSLLPETEYPFLKGKDMKGLVMHLDDTPIYDHGQSFQTIIGQRTTNTETVLYLEDVTWGNDEDEKYEEFALIQISMRNGSNPKIKMLIKEFLSSRCVYPSRCVNPSTGEIYVVDEKLCTFTLYVYEYPPKSLIDLCVDVISRKKLPILILPEELRERFCT